MTLPTDPASLARGQHLAESVAGCKSCHSPDFTGGHGPPPSTADTAGNARR